MFNNLSDLFKSRKESQKKLVLFQSIQGSVAAERFNFDFIKSWDGAIIRLNDEKLSLQFPDKRYLEIKLIFHERDSPMIVRKGFLNGLPIRVISVENSYDSITIGSFDGIGFAVLFKTVDESNLSTNTSRNILYEKQYISFLEEKIGIINQNKGRVLIAEFEELVINFACFEILCLRRMGKFSNTTETQIIVDITTVAKQMVSQYDDSHATMAKMHVQQNCNWDGMWEHLKKYFKNNFNANIA